MFIRRVRQRSGAVAVAFVAAVAVWVLVAAGMRVDIVMKAAGIPSNAIGDRRVRERRARAGDPALVMVAAVAPLALIAGGVVLLFGGRRGMQIVGTSLGVLLLLGSVTALID